jgi:hypothetical protein
MPDSVERRIVVGFNNDASYLWQMLVDKKEVEHGGRVVESGVAAKDAMALVAAHANTPCVGQLNGISNRSIGVLHTEDRQYINDERVLVTPSSFRTPVVWGVLLCSLHRLKAMVSCESAANGSDLRCVITSEDVIHLLRKAHGVGDAVREEGSYLRLSSSDAYAFG